MKRGTRFAALVMMASLLIGFAPVNCAEAQEKIYTVVIDPGHGGDNQGANAYGPLEKDMTLVTGLAMYQALSQYDNVRVYMTRNTDASLFLNERAAIAGQVNADLLVSLHYNATVDHMSYGSEVLISRVQPYHAIGWQFGVIELSELKNMGMYIRGMKARQGNSGDYYGLLRAASSLGVPSVIIEHSYIDETSDHNRCVSAAQQEAFGRADAAAVAKYFGLYSTALGVDYRGYPKQSVSTVGLVPASVDDQSAPEELVVSQVSANASTGEVVLHIHGLDRDDVILYYTYSLDGGQTYAAPMLPWYGADTLNNSYVSDFNLLMRLTPGQNATVVLRARNQFDRDSVSAPLNIVWR